jgi:hypothetical protein
MPHKLVVALDRLCRLLLVNLHAHCSVGLLRLHTQWSKVFVEDIHFGEVHCDCLDIDEGLGGAKDLVQAQEAPQNQNHDGVEDIDFPKIYRSVIADLYPSQSARFCADNRG